MEFYGLDNRVHGLSKTYGNEDGKHIANTSRVLVIIANT